MGGYHAVAVRGDVSAETLVRAVYLGDGDRVERWGSGSLPDTGRAGTVGVSAISGWTVAFGPTPETLGSEEDAATLAGLSRGGSAFRWLMQDASGAVGIDLFTDGVHRRGFLSAEGEVEAAHGEPLGGEPPGGLEKMDLTYVDEWTIVEVMEAHVVPWYELAQAEYRLFHI